jgi:hypothetical protein
LAAIEIGTKFFGFLIDKLFSLKTHSAMKCLLWGKPITGTWYGCGNLEQSPSKPNSYGLFFLLSYINRAYKL